jgi:hypothetical protein
MNFQLADDLRTPPATPLQLCLKYMALKNKSNKGDMPVENPL